MKTMRTWLWALALIASTSLLAPPGAYAKDDKEKKDKPQQAQEGKKVPPGQAKKQGNESQVRAQQAQQQQAQRQAAENQRALQQQQQQHQAAAKDAQKQQAKNQKAVTQQVQRQQKTQQKAVVASAKQQQRLSQQRQQQLIAEQRQRSAQYATQLNRQTQLAQQRAAALQQQKRMNQYAFQQQYLQRLQQQQIAVRNAATVNYNNDPYFYTAPTYRYRRAGTYYQVNQYAADELRRAVNLGYEEGFRAGRADRADGWRYDSQNSYAYQDANYGYDGRYVSQVDYNYYFRQGYSKGYEDGYNARSQYGTQASGNISILTAVLQQILNLLPLR